MASIVNEIVSVIVKLVITVAGTAFMTSNTQLFSCTHSHLDDLVHTDLLQVGDAIGHKCSASNLSLIHICDPKYLLGDIWKGVTNTAVRDEFKHCNAYARPECKDCWATVSYTHLDVYKRQP